MTFVLVKQADGTFKAKTLSRGSCSMGGVPICCIISASCCRSFGFFFGSRLGRVLFSSDVVCLEDLSSPLFMEAEALTSSIAVSRSRCLFMIRVIFLAGRRQGFVIRTSLSSSSEDSIILCSSVVIGQCWLQVSLCLV